MFCRILPTIAGCCRKLRGWHRLHPEIFPRVLRFIATELQTVPGAEFFLRLIIEPHAHCCCPFLRFASVHTARSSC